MKRTVTKQYLVNILSDMETQAEKSICFVLFNSEKIKMFNSKNAVAIRKVRAEADQLIGEYATKDEAGKIKLVPGGQDVVFESPERKKEFQDAWAAHMAENVEIFV